jgi:hypothetical protein
MLPRAGHVPCLEVAVQIGQLAVKKVANVKAGSLPGFMDCRDALDLAIDKQAPLALLMTFPAPPSVLRIAEAGPLPALWWDQTSPIEGHGVAVSPYPESMRNETNRGPHRFLAGSTNC